MSDWDRRRTAMRGFGVLIFFALAWETCRGLSGFNAAYLKEVDANITCGSPPEKYYKTQQGDILDPRDRIPFMCNASDETLAHPPRKITDGSLATNWQSTAREDVAFIVIDMKQFLFVHNISITFGDYRRPGAIRLEKSSELGSPQFIPWHYLVSSPGSVNCLKHFAVDYYTGVIDRVDRVVCKEYERYTPLEFNETVHIDLAGDQRSNHVNDPHSATLLDWLSAVTVRFRFNDMFRKFDQMSFAWHHYTVREIEVAARCSCNGHSDGSICPLNTTSGLRQCLCQGNTCGMNCEKCCPLFNQVPWQKGSGAPWANDPTASCEPCNCHSHADACVYNKTVDELGLSLNTSGHYSGGGVCLNCKDNTEGVNCEKCKRFYYRPLGKRHKDVDACQACDCDVVGTANASGLEFGECLRDADHASDYPGKAPGDCSCKRHVIGRRCDRCKPEYYRLTSDNHLGCIECQCRVLGTVNGSNVCDGSYEGLCPCKQNVGLRDCSQCKDGFYNLTESNVEGCTDCECDPGGTITPKACNKTTGICECRPHVTGRLCKGLEPGYYYPGVHFIHAAKNPYRAGNDELHVFLDTPRTAFYLLLVSYTMGDSEGDVQLNVTVRHTNDSGEVAAGGRFEHITVTAAICRLLMCRLELPFLRESDSKAYLEMERGRWQIDITATDNRNDLSLDRIIAIPEQFLTAEVLDSATFEAFIFSCSVIGNDMQIGGIEEELCLSSVFSLTMAFLNGGLPCSCSPVGSHNHTTCQQYEGQCACKPGVEGRDCSRCRPGYYNLTDQGCTPCGCRGPNQVCDVVTGECVCPANSVGRTCEACQCNNNTEKCLRTGECLECQYNTTGFYCEECQNGTYGDPLNQECKACGCDPVGSLGSDCDRATGQCVCKRNVEGRNCSSCVSATYRMDAAGCHECQCNPFGSTSLQCDDSGQCPCKENATDTKCTQCMTGFYGLPDMPCTECGCNSTGTIAGSVCTNDTAGQCRCKPGVARRACDECDKFFTHFNESGCVACPRCVKTLQGLIEATELEFNSAENKTDRLDGLLGMHGPLENVRDAVRQTENENSKFHVRLEEGRILRENIRDSRLPNTNGSLKILKTQATELSAHSTGLEKETAEALEYLEELENSTTQAREMVTRVDRLIKYVMETFKAHTKAGSQAETASFYAVHSVMARSFSGEFEEIERKTQEAENISTFVQQMAVKVFNHSSLADHFKMITMEAKYNFTSMQDEWERTREEFLQSINDVYAQFGGIHAQMDEIQNLLTREKQLLDRAQNKAAQTDGIVNETKDALDQATAAFEQYKSMVAAVSGELEVAMLEYDSDQNELLVKVLKGRQLAARDLPGLTSDVYVLVSTIPDWENEGVKKSNIINGTVSPVFPEFDIYRFKITQARLPITKLRIVVFDYDSDDEDDFMGEVIIDLGTSGDLSQQSSTKWYKIQPQDVSELGTGHFTPTSGLVDVTNLLQAQVEKVKPQLGSAWAGLSRALERAVVLEDLEQQIESTFNSSHAHGAFAVSAIQRYVTIQQLLNSSVELMLQSKETLASIMAELSRIPVHELRLNAQQAKDESALFYSQTAKRNETIYVLDDDISAANATFLRAIPQWYEINQQFPVMQSAAVSLQAAAVEAPSVLPTLIRAEIKSAEAHALLSVLLDKLSSFSSLLDDLVGKITFMETAAQTSTSLVDDAFDQVRNASETLAMKPDEDVLKANAIKRDLPTSRTTLELSLESLSQKAHQLGILAGKFALALHLVNESSAQYPLNERSLERGQVNDVTFDVRTNSSSGLVLSLVGNPGNMTSAGSSWPRDSVAVYLENGRVSAALALQEGTTIVTNPMQLNADEWYNVHLTWTGAKLFLTVRSNLTQQVTRSAVAPALGGESGLQVDNTSALYVGGFPGDVMANLTSKYGHYIGVIDNLAVDQAKYKLWRPENFVGTRLYAPSRHPRRFYPDTGEAASFFGTGLLQHEMGQFETSTGHSQLELDFRTFQKDGMLFAVTDARGRYVFAVFLENGRVNFKFEINQDSAVEMSSAKSSYNNGKWYHVRATRTATNSSLTIMPVGSSGTTPDTRAVHTGAANMVAGTTITFGAPDPQSNIAPPLREVFSGDMRNARLSGSPGSPPERRMFNNQSLTRTERGVANFGVINGKVEPGVRFYGYTDQLKICSYASVTTQLASISSLTLTFKTSDLSGLLLYSSKESQGSAVSVYVALLHGNLLVLLNDSSSPSGSAHFQSSGINFSDNKWRTVHLNYSQDGFSLYANNTHVHTGWFGNLREPLQFAQTVYVGGVPSGVRIPSHLPVTWCFRGGMKHLFLDSTQTSLFSGDSVGVSRANVFPAVVPPRPPPIPPSCGDVLAPLQFMSEHNTVKFGGLGEGKETYRGFTLDEKQRYILKTTSRIVLHFRALSADGVVFYMADSATHPTQFISLEMLSGHLYYQFDAGTGPIEVTSALTYATGEWYKAHIFRVINMGSLYVEQTLDYKKNKANLPVPSLNMSVLYVGGVPAHVTAPHLANRRVDFSGCLRGIELKATRNESTVDLSAPDHAGSDAASGSCFKDVQPGLGFNSSGWTQFGNVTLGGDFDIQLEFRTSTRNGLLLRVDDNSTGVGQEPKNALTLEQLDGKVLLTYNSSQTSTRAVWIEPGYGNKSDSSYFLCQMDWHTIRLHKNRDNITMVIDQLPAVSVIGPGGGGVAGHLYIGGLPAHMMHEDRMSGGFRGCVRALYVDGKTVDLTQAKASGHVTLGCPMNAQQGSALLA